MKSAIFSRFGSPWQWLALGLSAVFLRGLFLDVMDVDASQYASIAMEMLQGGQWLQVQHRGGDYLDKPPLLFWLSAASFGLFGLSNWAYKLPSLLGALAGVWATYRFARLFYGEKTARHAGFILASSLGFVVICNDVRTDTLLLGMVACATWQLAEYQQFNRWRNLLAGFVFIGLAMLAKGPIGLVAPAFAVGSHLLLRRDWRGIFRWQWLAGLAVVGLVLAPMCWGLWQQFDLQPQKVVNGRSGVSGLYFFFWEQSFGRITGENVWKNDTSGFYFLHVYLWAFLPWCLLLPRALWQQSRLLLSGSAKEFFALGGFALSFVALSQSQYKLPHYIFVTLPWAAVLVAAQMETERSKWGRIARAAALGVPSLAALFVAHLAVFWVFPTRHFWVGAMLAAATIFFFWKILKNPFPTDNETVVQRGVAVAALVAFVLNFHFYPHLLPFQSTAEAGRFLQKNNVPPTEVAFLNHHGHALDFCLGGISRRAEDADDVQKMAARGGGLWLYTDLEGKNALDSARVRCAVEAEFRHFQVALLKPTFLDPATRAATLESRFLLKISPSEKQ
jgi:4-amino-4-deoxy-L-arabinose transferase-like glycosyltransferase